MKTQAQIIKNVVNGIFVQSVMREKGWSKQEAADKAAAWLVCGKSISFHDYIIAQ